MVIFVFQNSPMSKLRWLSLLMLVTILALTGFQVYWLKENYDREKNSLDIRSQFLFRDAMMQLQVSKLNLPGMNDSAGNNVNLIMEKGKPSRVKVSRRNDIISTINIMREKVKDSAQNPPRPMVIALDKATVNLSRDSVKLKTVVGGPNQIFELLYDVDSLQDSIRVQEVDSAFRTTLDREGLDIPFSIKRTETETGDIEPEMHKIRIGIRSPVTYELVLGNTFSYLIRKISLPIIFSILLLGVSITSFVLLYRNFAKQKRLTELKNEFISNITHELKTPIATVGVAIEALRNFNAIQDPQRTREYLDISSNELQRLGLLVDKVLKLSMFEKKEMGIQPENVDLGQITDEVTASLRLQLEKFNAVLHVEKQGDLTLEADRLHLLSVVFNLVDNSLKYSTGIPWIDILVKGTEASVELRISDKGIGIPKEYKERIFEKFFRVPQGNTHNAKGYGLGLSYVSHVVAKHQGRIEVQDNTDGGTIFTIQLPKKQV